MRRFPALVAMLTLVASCDKVDKVLEGHVAPLAHLSIAVAPTPLSVAQGEDAAITVTVTRVGDYSGPVDLAAENLPAGVTAVLSPVPSGVAITTITLRVSANAALGSYLVIFRAKANELTDATTPLSLAVVAPPAYAFTMPVSDVSVVRGGDAPISVQVSRSNFNVPIALSLEGQTGFSMVAAENPLTSSATSATITAATAVSPGTYSLTLRGKATGLSDRTVTITAVVTNDAFQIVARPSIAVAQGASIIENLIVNRPGFAGALTASVSGLPSGVVASIAPSPITANGASMTLTADPDAQPGTYTGTLTASNGSQSVASTFALVVQSSNIAVTPTPAAISMLPANSSTVAVALTRSALSGPVALSVTGAPAGVTATFDSASISGNAATLTISAGSTAAAGQYSLTLRATPQSWSANSGRTALVALTIRPSGVTTSNVLLDWSACTSPVWVAYRDGTGAWTQVSASNGQFRFSITAAIAAFAYAEGGRGTTGVRYMTQEEITAAPIDMCAPPAGTKTAVLTAQRLNPAETVNYSLGGGSGAASGSGQNFTILGIHAGVHDLLGWGITPTGNRGLLKRDINLPDGGNLGTLSLTGGESFTPTTALLRYTGTVSNGDAIGYAMSVYTTVACVQNPLYSFPSFPNPTTIFGIPPSLERGTDFHVVAVTASSGAGRRTATVAFSVMSDQLLTLAAPIAAPQVTSLTGPYKRLQATFAVLPAEYNATISLSYTDGSVQTVIGATRAYLNATALVLVTPDFSGVSGWSTAFGVAASANGAWSTSSSGQSSSASTCTEGRRTSLTTQTGTY